MNKGIPEGGRYVKCARCAHQWRLLPDEPEELAETLEFAPQSSAEEEAAASVMSAASQEAGREDASLEVRRGNFAAGMASLGEPPAMRYEGVHAEPETEGASPTRGWAATEAEEPSAVSALDEQAEFDRQVASAAADRWMGGASWTKAERDGQADDFDPENSIRQALNAALADQDESDKDMFGMAGSPSRSVYPDNSFDKAAASGDAENESANGDALWASPGVLDARSGGKQAGLYSDEPDPAESDSSLDAETANADASAGSLQRDDGRFQSDMAGIFEKPAQPKRSFARSAARAPHDSTLTDYDGESGDMAGAADDQYTADGPLDADASALQAALEGTLRDRHGGESKAGGGGGLALAAAWAVFLSVLSGVTLALVTFRDEMVGALPGTSAIYRNIGLTVQDRQIDFGPVSYRWTVTDGKPMIEVTGQIINLTDRETTVPRVLINVRDTENSDAVKATATVRSEPLAAHETAEFTLEFLSPPKTITHIELAFAETE